MGEPGSAATAEAVRPISTMARVLSLALLATGLVTVTGTARAQPAAPGALFAWGDDSGFQLGDATPGGCSTDDVDPCHTEPAPVPIDLDGVTEVHGGDLHALAVLSDGRVFNWGSAGRVADDPDGGNAETPVEVSSLHAVTITSVAAGGDHSLALATDGTVWSWGRNDVGQLGRGVVAGPEATFDPTPQQVIRSIDPETGASVPLSGVVGIAAGESHSLALVVDGETRTVWAWGSNRDGQLGQPAVEGTSAFPVQVVHGSGEFVAPLDGVSVVGAGRDHSLAVDGFGNVWSWGRNDSGQLARETDGVSQFSAGQVDGVSSVDAVAAGDAHTLIRVKDGTLYAAGSDGSGQLGDGGTVTAGETSSTPVLIDALTADRIAAGGSFSLATASDGTLYAWGDDSAGQLGRGEGGGSSASPGTVPGLGGVSGLGAGRLTAYAIQVAPAIENLALTVAEEILTGTDAIDGPIGIPEIDLSGLDVGVLPLFDNELESAPLRSNPLRSNPLRSNELRANPLRSNPLRANPLRSNPLRSNPLRSNPLRSNPLRSNVMPDVYLSEVPLLLAGGWPAILAGEPIAPELDLGGAAPVATPFAGLPVQTVTLQQVLDLPAGDHPQVDALTLEDIDVTSTPLRSNSVQTFLFAGPTLNQLSSSLDWCTELAEDGFACPGTTDADHEAFEDATTLTDLHFQGAPVDAIEGLPHLLVREANLAGSPAANYDLGHVNVAATSIGDVLAADLPVGTVDCSNATIFDCNASTLADAVAATRDTDNEIVAPDAMLGDVLACDGSDVSVCGDLIGFLDLGDVVRMLVDPAKLLWADKPLEPLALGTPVDTNLVRYTASADVACPEVDVMSFRIEIPARFRYQLGSASFDFAGTRFEGEQFSDPEEYTFDREVAIIGDGMFAPAPTDGPPPRQPLTWNVFGFDCGSSGVSGPAAHVQLSFVAQPWIDLGTKTAGVTLSTSSGASQSIAHTAPFAVLDAFEPNDITTAATQVQPGVLYLSHLADGDPVDHFEIVNTDGSALARGTLVTAVISHLPADFDLQLNGPASAPLRSNPLRSNPLRSNPLRSNPVEDDGLSGDGSGLVLEPDLLQDVPRFDGAGSELLSVSAHDGVETEVVSAVVTAHNATEPLTIAVTSYLSEVSDQPYTLQVFVEPPPQLNCQPQTAFTGGTVGSLPAPVSVPADARTLVLYNHQRLSARYGDAAVADVLAAWESALAGDVEAGPFVLVPVDGDAGVRDAYAAWDADPCEPERANDVVREIVRVQDTYTAVLPELRFVTILGDDDQVPSLRVPDLVTLSNQRDYYPDLVFGEFDNALSAAAGLGYLTSDGAFGDLDPIGWLGHELLVSELAVGRLVETPGDMVAALGHYGTQPYITVEQTLVSAYDFLLDGGEDTAAALTAAQSPLTTSTLFSDTWLKSDVLAEFGEQPDVAAVNGHFNHYEFLTAAGNCPEAENPTDPCPAVTPSDEIATSSEALAAGLALGAHLFTVGCNAGINVPALAAVSPSPADTERLFDWAEALAGIQGSLFGNSGYGYGDTELNLYSERLMTHYAGFLDGSMTLAQAAVAARHAYISELGLPGAYDDKVVAESTFYGLPFVRVGTGGSIGQRHDHLALPPAELTGLTMDTLSGSRATSFTVFPSFELVHLGRGDFWQVVGVGSAPAATDISAGTEPLLTSHYRPVQPEITLDLEPAPEGTSLGDVLITGLSSVEAPLDDPYFVRPTFDLGANEPEPRVLDAVFPASLGNVNPEGNLILHPGQYRSDPTTPGSGQQIRFTRIDGEILYPDTPSEPPVRPTFTQVLATDLGSTAFFVEASPAELVLVVFKIPGEPDWGSVLLNEVAPGVWSGFTPHDVEEFFVQAVNGGVVGTARGKGLNFQPSATTFAGSGFQIEVTGTTGDNGWYTTPPTVTLVDTAPGTSDDDASFEVSLNFAGFAPVTGEPPTVGVASVGLNLLQARRSNGDRAAAFIAVDTVDPTAVVSPATGSVFGVDEIGLGEVCADVGSGVNTCTATLDGVAVGPGRFQLDTSPGTHTIEATVTDFAGRSQSAQVTYEARYIFEGFFAPVENPDVVNVVEAGSTIPIKFRLMLHDGTVVDDTAAINSIRSVWMGCPNATESTTADDDPSTSTAATGLRFDAETQQFVFNWKTGRSWSGCRELQVETIDGVTHVAWFRFE